MAIHCTDCGTELPDNAEFCFSCGKPVKDKSPNSKKGKHIYECPYCSYRIYSKKSEESVEFYCPICNVYREFSLGGYKSSLRIEGTSASDVQKVLASAIQGEGQSSLPIRLNPWISGSFYLIAFVVLVVALLVVGKLVPLLIFPIIVIGGILALSVIGAFQLRQDDRLSDDNFLKLMALSFKYLPWIRRRDAKVGKHPSD